MRSAIGVATALLGMWGCTPAVTPSDNPMPADALPRAETPAISSANEAGSPSPIDTAAFHPTPCAPNQTRVNHSWPKFGVFLTNTELPCPLELPPTAAAYTTPMELERAETARANPTHPDGSGNEHAPVCVYTGCLPLSVVATAPPVSCVAPKVKTNFCILPPESGVTVGAPPPYKACPAAIAGAGPGFAQTFGRGTFPAPFDATATQAFAGRPYVIGNISTDTACCYDTCDVIHVPRP